ACEWPRPPTTASSACRATARTATKIWQRLRTNSWPGWIATDYASCESRRQLQLNCISAIFILAECRQIPRAEPRLRLRWAENRRLIDAVAVEVAGNRLIAGLSELNDAVGRIDPPVAVRIDDPLAGAEDGDLFYAVAVEVADDRQVTFLAEL